MNARPSPLLAAAAAVAVTLIGTTAMATERPTYATLATFDGVEIREYPALVVAETTVEGRREEAGNEAFRRLAGYIFGGNRGKKSIAMTAPVTQTPGQKIAMTAPVTQTATAADRWVVQFTMPSTFTLDTLPDPDDDRVTLRVIPARKVAVRAYSGRWADTLYLKELTTLRAALGRAGVTTLGEATWARYDPPWTPWFLRTNEIHLEVDSAPQLSAQR